MKWIIGFKSGKEIVVDTENSLAAFVESARVNGVNAITLSDDDVKTEYLRVEDISYVQRVLHD